MKFQSEKKNTEDNQCFKWSIVRALNLVKIHPEHNNKAIGRTSKHSILME